MVERRPRIPVPACSPSGPDHGPRSRMAPGRVPVGVRAGGPSLDPGGETGPAGSTPAHRGDVEGCLRGRLEAEGQGWLMDEGLTAGPTVEGALRTAPRSLTRAGLLVAAAMAVGNGFNFLYQWLMSRMLG